MITKKWLSASFAGIMLVMAAVGVQAQDAPTPDAPTPTLHSTGASQAQGTAQSTDPVPAPPQQPGFEQLRRYLHPKPVAQDKKGAKALYDATLELWADNGLYFIDFSNNRLDYAKRTAWLEKWKKRGSEIKDEKDFKAADMLAQMAVDELGRFNYYLPPIAVQAEDHGADPTVVGIGARLEQVGIEEVMAKFTKDTTPEEAKKAMLISDELPIRLSPVKDSPAAKAGILDGDILKAVDGVSVNGKSVDEVIKLVKGKEGSKVELEVARTTKDAEGKDKTENVKVPVVRQKFTYPVVTVTKLEDDIVVIKYDNFSAGNGLAEMRAAFLEVQKMKVQEKKNVKVILDLRGNPGGLLDFAVQIASWIIPEGTITTIREREGYNLVTKRWSLTRDALFYTYPAAVNPQNFIGYEGQKHELIIPEDVPIVCLINGDSYSASELMAGAIQANRRGLVVGMPSGGKGEGQQVFGLPEGRRGKVIKFFFAPGDKEIDWAGVHPDQGWQVEWTKPAKRGDDNQLDVARKAVKQEFDRIEAAKARATQILTDGTKERKAEWEKQRDEQRTRLEEKLKKHREQLIEDAKKAAEEKKAGENKPTGSSDPNAPAPPTDDEEDEEEAGVNSIEEAIKQLFGGMPSIPNPFDD